jgi:hypothetical protein
MALVDIDTYRQMINESGRTGTYTQGGTNETPHRVTFGMEGEDHYTHRVMAVDPHHALIKAAEKAHAQSGGEYMLHHELAHHAMSGTLGHHSDGDTHHYAWTDQRGGKYDATYDMHARVEKENI